jgi:hypothetical protein
MSQQLWKPVILALASLSISALVPLTVGAQDRDEHQDQRAQDQRAQDHQDEQTRHDDRGDEKQRDDRGDAMRRDDHHDDNRGDPATQYRHDHPRASARCQDGFFTTTRDRGRACSKHGGIDVWISL